MNSIMKKKDAQPFSELITGFINDNYVLKRGLAEHRAVKGWNELLGEGVSKYTRNVYYSRGVLHVRLSSSVLASELRMSKDNLIERINEYAGEDVVDDIVLR